MYVGANAAMRHRRRLEAPTCAVPIMQQPDLGVLGRMPGAAVTTLGDLVNVGGLPVQTSATSSFSLPSLTTILVIAGLGLAGYMWWKGRGPGAPSIGLPSLTPRRHRRSRRRVLLTTALTIGAAGAAAGYLYGKGTAGA